MLNLSAALDEIAATTDLFRNARLAFKPGATDELIRGIIENLRASGDKAEVELRAALENAARRIDRVTLAVTGLRWLGSGVPSVEQELVNLVRGANRELTLCTYSITNGAKALIQELKQAAQQGVVVTLAVNQFSGQPDEIKAALAGAAHQFPDHWRILDFDSPRSHAELHAKIMVVDRQAALLGSANLSFHGLVSNHEMAVVIVGPTAEGIANRVDRMLVETTRLSF